MTSSSLDYAKKIDTSYPSAGKDNPSQGFRDNFKNIYQALISISDNINYLQQTTIKISQIIYPNNLPLPKVKTSTEVGDVGVYPDFFPLTNVSSFSAAGGTYFQVTSTQNVLVNATVNFITTSTTYLVGSITPDTTITPTTTLPTIVGTTSYFKNPYFESAPITYTLSNFSSSTNFGRVERPIGTIYATKTRLEVQFNNYGTTGSSVNSNTFIINMPADTVPNVTDNSSNLAKTNFTHRILPYGTIIMWFGKRSKVPTGWAICDGENGTPDLISKFPIGGEFDYINIITGEYEGPGSSINGVNTTTQADLPQVELLDVPYHTHLATFTGTSQSHSHMLDELPHSHKFFDLMVDDAEFGGANMIKYGFLTTTTSNTTTGVTIAPAFIIPYGTVDIRSAGTDVTESNYILPSFAALYHIMKITGEDLTT
jgi:hypothetical protein